MYDIFNNLLLDSNVKASDVSRATKIPPSTFSDWKSGRSFPKQDKLDLISNFFKVDPRIFKNEQPSGYCYDCGLAYTPNYEPDIKLHDSTHKNWKKAIDKFGFCWTYAICENAKFIARSKLADGKSTQEEKIDANIDIMKALFSRSLSSSGFDIRHVDFPTYVAMLLNQNIYKNKIDKKTYEYMVKKYGTLPGIDEGVTNYTIPETKTSNMIVAESSQPYTIAAHKEDGESWTAEELTLIEEYKKLLLAARSNQYHTDSKKALFLRLDLSKPENYYDGKALGNYLKELRTSHGLSHYKMFIESGVHRTTLQKIENGIYVHECYIEKAFSYFNIDNPMDLCFDK